MPKLILSDGTVVEADTLTELLEFATLAITFKLKRMPRKKVRDDGVDIDRIHYKLGKVKKHERAR